MVTYKCDRCNKVFKQKSHFQNHLNRKNPCLQFDCEKIAKKMDIKDIQDTKCNTLLLRTNPKLGESVSCKYCKKMFKYKCNLSVHIKSRCKIKKQMDNEREAIFQELLKKMEMLEKENIEIKEKNKQLEHKMTRAKRTYKKNIIENCNNVNNTQNNIINNTILLVGYGKEDIMKLDKQKIVRAVSAGFYSTNKLTDLVHFDPKHPEYHNVYIGNMKDKYAMMYDGTNWILTTKSELIDKIYESKKSFIEENFEEFCKLLTPHQTQSLERWLDTDEEDPKIAEIKESIKLLLYNKRGIPLQTRDGNLLQIMENE